jgi:tetrapyrrole methylase family protein/MazG family protein
MNNTGITLLGLGPGNPGALTREAWNILEESKEVWLRTRQHPLVEALPDHLDIHTFDHLYEREETFEGVYEQIIEQVLSLGRRPEGVVYAVPGHPYIAEATCPAIAQRAREQGLEVRVIDGLSFLEPTMTALGIDPLPHTALLDALALAAAHAPPFPPSAAAIVAQIYSREVASDVKLTLMGVYPDEHPVKLIHAAGTIEEKVEALALYEIDRSPYIGTLTTLYVHPLDPATSFEAFQDVIAHLRAPDGCPWDREQTHQTLRTGLLEETYEVLSAIDVDDPEAMREEFGDLLLLIMMHAQIAAEYGEFTMADVLHDISNKIVHRHPHVFGDLKVGDPGDVLLNWERMKAEERAANGKAEASLLDGVNLAIPALLQAYQYQLRAAHIGFDWPDVQGVWEKYNEELDEFRTADTESARADEMGDLLFSVVNLSRWYKIDPESALREANTRFRGRFTQIEAAARSQGRQTADLSLDEMEALWQSAKNNP